MDFNRAEFIFPERDCSEPSRHFCYSASVSYQLYYSRYLHLADGGDLWLGYLLTLYGVLLCAATGALCQGYVPLPDPTVCNYSFAKLSNKLQYFRGKVVYKTLFGECMAVVALPGQQCG
jgi:hypothetical protein